MRERAGVYARLMRLDRPIGAWLLLWPALWALWLAGEGRPDPWNVVVFACGVILMRSAGCVINDYADRGIDGHVHRTRHRPFAQGEVSTREAFGLFIALSLCAFGLVLTLDRFTVALSLVALFLAATYPFMKRYTHLPQVYLGMAFGWAVPMAFAAETGAIPQGAWLLYVAAVLWTTIYDTMYAMVDREDDLRIGVKSTAILFGDGDRMIIGVLQVLLFIVLLVVGSRFGIDRGYYHAGLAVAAILALWQQCLIRSREPDACFRAFLNNNWFGMAIFIGLLLHSLAS
ncbi:MAG: 4-hydroxybenzoate octaprenyltransferase [Gammaproteobacteria bacterium]|nr:4-hydroxybenzoate octaprenyltransferase [Gammaproteobacteria bacterium]